MNPRAIIRMARVVGTPIGKHVPLIGTGTDDSEYRIARAASDVAVSLAKYLICHLDSAHDARLFARAVGMPGYMYLR